MGKVYIGNKEVSPLLVHGGTTDGLTKDQADKLYVGKTDANNTYLKKTDANNTYLKKSEANNKLLPSQTGNSGKFLSTDGSTPVWVDAPSSSGDSLAGRAPSGGIIVGADADAGPNGVAVGDSSQSAELGTAIGSTAYATSYGIAIGRQAKSNASYGTAIGSYAKSNASDAIQIGQGQNDDASTLKVGLYPNNYTLLTSDGLIPSERVALGGETGQVLTKTDNGMEWVIPTSGNGGISSIHHDNTLIGDGSAESPLSVNQDALEDTVIIMEW